MSLAYTGLDCKTFQSVDVYMCSCCFSMYLSADGRSDVGKLKCKTNKELYGSNWIESTLFYHIFLFRF